MHTPPVNTSATRVQTWQDCRRKWWYDTCTDRKGESTPAQALGTAVHAHIEAYLKTGEWPQVDALADPASYRALQIALAGMREAEDFGTGEKIPAPLPRLRELMAAGVAGAEVDFSYPAGTIGPLVFRGQIDFQANAPHFWIFDHKTTKDLHAPWQLDELGLAHNVQLLTYAALAWDKIPPRVRIAHIRYVTNPPYRCVVVATTVSGAILAAHLDSLRGWVTEMHADGQQEHPDAVIADTSACYKYGGCQHKSICSATRPQENAVLRTITAEEAKGQTNMFKKSAPAAAGPAITPAAAFDGTIGALAVLLIVACSKYGALNVQQLALATGATPEQIGAVEAVLDTETEGVWTRDDNGKRTATKLDAAQLDELAAYLDGLPDEDEPAAVVAPRPAAAAINPPDAVEDDEERAAALDELDAIEKKIGSAELMRIAKANDVQRPRKCGTPKLQALLVVLRAAVGTPAPVQPSSKTGMVPAKTSTVDLSPALATGLPVIFANPAVTNAIARAVGGEVGGAFLIVCVP